MQLHSIQVLSVTHCPSLPLTVTCFYPKATHDDSTVSRLLQWFNCCGSVQTGLDFFEAQMVGTLPTNLSSDVSYRGDAFTYEADTALNFADLTGGWCTGNEVGKHSRLATRVFWDTPRFTVFT